MGGKGGGGQDTVEAWFLKIEQLVVRVCTCVYSNAIRPVAVADFSR